MKKNLILITLLICVFFLGAIANNIYAYYTNMKTHESEIEKQNLENKISIENLMIQEESPNKNTIIKKALELFETTTEQPSPMDRITEDQITVLKDKVVIDIDNAKWAYFTDTNSMDPIIDIGSHAIEIIPESEDEIQIGDIVAYESEYAKGTIIHRVITKAKDEKGTYFIMKGDNNPTSDPGKIRFEQIKRVVVAIIY